MKRTTWLLIGLLGAGAIGGYATQRAIGIDRLTGLGIARSSQHLSNDFSLDGTLEPDEIPGIAQSSDYASSEDEANETNGQARTKRSVFAPDDAPISVGGPARLSESITSSVGSARFNEEPNLFAEIKERRVEPPKRLKLEDADSNIHFDEDNNVSLVQFRFNRNTRSNTSQSVQQQQPATAQQGTQQPRTNQSVQNQQSQQQQQRRQQANASRQQTQIEPEQPKEPEVKLPAEHPESLKRSIKTTLLANAKRPLTTQNNSPGEILMMSLPYGADAQVYQPNPNANPRDRQTPRGSYIYSIGTLCWNYPCNGKTLLRSDGQRVVAKVGNGYQRRPASLLALLAMSNIMPNYEMKVDGGIFSIANLIASEKAAVSKGANLSMALVGLSFYGNAKESWKNEMGETWSIEKMVVEELNRNIDQGTCDVTDWLLGLTAAVNLYEEEGRALRGPMALAKRQLKTYQDFVLSVQNEQYLWHPKFFLFKGISPDAYETVYSGGHVLRWLVLALPESELHNVRVRRAVANLAAAIHRIPVNTPAGSLSDKQLEGIAVSLQALALYHQRAFGVSPLLDAPEKTAEADDKSVARR